MTRGGTRKGAGRPSGTIKTDKAKQRTIRLTDSEYTKYKEKGGTSWLREMLKG